MTVLTPTDDNRYPDAETKKIVEELEKQGIKSEFRTPESAPITDDESDEDEDDESKKEESKPEEIKKEEKQEKVELKDENNKPEDKQFKRPVMIPIARVKQNEKELKRQLESSFSDKISELTNQVQKLQQQIDSGSATQKQADSQDAKLEELTKTANSIAEKHGSDPELVTDLLKAVQSMTQKGVEIPEELSDAIKTIKQNKEEIDHQRESQKILAQYDDEYHTNILSDKSIADEIRASGLTLDEFKSKMSELVLGEEGDRYSRLTLKEVYALKKADLLPKKAKTAESQYNRLTTGSSESGAKELSADEIRNMSIEEFAKYSDSLGKSKSRITRNGRPIN